jgi:hypothetical protein
MLTLVAPTFVVTSLKLHTTRAVFALVARLQLARMNLSSFRGGGGMWIISKKLNRADFVDFVRLQSAG